MKDHCFTVMGRNAMAIFDDGLGWNEKLKVIPLDGLQNVDKPAINLRAAQLVPIEYGEPLRSELQHFLSSIAQGSSPITSGDEAVTVMEVIEDLQNQAVLI